MWGEHSFVAAQWEIAWKEENTAINQQIERHRGESFLTVTWASLECGYVCVCAQGCVCPKCSPVVGDPSPSLPLQDHATIVPLRPRGPCGPLPGVGGDKRPVMAVESWAQLTGLEKPGLRGEESPVSVSRGSEITLSLSRCPYSCRRQTRNTGYTRREWESNGRPAVTTLNPLSSYPRQGKT